MTRSSPHPPRPSAASSGAKGQRSRRRILECAREVFFEQSFEEANLDEIARLAGLAKGTIYRYFDSKAELYVEVLLQDADAFVKRLQQTVDPALPPEAQIRRTGLFYLRHYSAHRHYFRIFWALENQSLIGALPESLVHSVTAVWKRCLQIVADQIARGIREGRFRECDAWEMANIVWFLGNGIIHADERPELSAILGRDRERVFEDALDLIIRGLRPVDPRARED